MTAISLTADSRASADRSQHPLCSLPVLAVGRLDASVVSAPLLARATVQRATYAEPA
jgi:hypothetical protein